MPNVNIYIEEGAFAKLRELERAHKLAHREMIARLIEQEYNRYCGRTRQRRANESLPIDE